MNDERNPVDQLVDLLVYAPIGLLYERDDVLPRLVTRGRSQVQLARVLGQLAVQRGQGQLEERLTEVLGAPGAGLAKLVTELGAMIGLAPPSGTDPWSSVEAPPAGAATDGSGADAEADEARQAAPPTSLPIAGYDRLRAREIIPLLVELSPAQRQAVREHELAHRHRKTVLHQIEVLGT